MKAQLPHPEHYSYLRHRKERVTKIILPVVISALVMLALIVWVSIATFKSDGDVSRWAAISTIWIAIPVLIAGLVTLAILVALIYLMARMLDALPHYTGIVQDYTFIARGYIIRGVTVLTNSVISFDSFISKIKTFFQRITP